MRFLLATTGLGAIAAATVAVPAHAETQITTAVTTPQTTSASGDIRITTTGSVKPTSGVAVTINTNNYVKNEGAIQITGSNNSAGIVANAGLSGEILNSGTITIDENYTPTDTDNDGDIDGLFAQGSGRFGIHVLGAHTGPVTNTGTITVEGNQSGGIVLEGPLTGTLSNSGNINVLGNDSIGIKAGAVSGDVNISKGAIQVQGANAVGVALNGDIGGALVIQGAVQTTGYRYTTAPPDVSKLDADDLLQGGSAVIIGGNVGGGILFDAKPVDNDANNPDEDGDGTPDANETTASISSLSGAPAVLIGSSTQATTIGAVAGSGGQGLVNKGSIVGNGLYKTIAGQALVIGGLGQTVNVAGGFTNSGTITGAAADANATGVRIGAGATVPQIVNSGTIAANGAGTATTSAQAIVIDAGSSVSTIKNTGTIRATRSGADGSGAGIVDKSGTVSLVENSGAIQVVALTTLGDLATAIDLSANITGATVNQLAVASGTAPSIDGRILFGSGNDTLNVADGTVNGATKFGTGNNTLSLSGDAVVNGAVQFGAGSDTVQLAGTSQLNGDIDFGGGSGILTLAGTSAYKGALAGTAGMAITLGDGTSLTSANLGTVDVGSLTVGNNAVLGVTIDSSTGTNTLFNVAGGASFGTGNSIDVQLVSLGGVAGTYKILQAGTLTGAAGLTSSVESLPFLFGSSLDTSTPNEISVVIRQKTAEELGINSSEAGILDAFLGAADADPEIAQIFLGIEDSESLQGALQQVLPDHAGGAFETATKGTRLLGRTLADPRAPLVRRGTLGIWAQQVAWGGSKAIGATSSYNVSGWGAAAGVETGVGPLGNVGLTLSYLAGKDGKKRSDNELSSSQYEGGLYFRGGVGPIKAFARGTVGMLNFDGERFFTGTINGVDFRREAKGKWKGRLFSGMAGVSYDARFGALSVRPTVSLEHFSLKEKGYTETGDSDAFNLTVGSRRSSETAAVATLALGYDLVGGAADSETFARVELEAGRRQILSGKLGTTTARFGDGTPFTLTPEDRTSGFLGALRIIGGGQGFSLTAEVNAEQQQDNLSLGARLGVAFAF
jgi:hypothetical protein